MLLLIFALLQGIAPLAHAHINGSNADKGLHLPEVELSTAHGPSTISQPGSIVETQDPGVQGGQSLDEYITAHALATGFLLETVEQSALHTYRSPVHPLTFPLTCSHRPDPQAPPACGTL